MIAEKLFSDRRELASSLADSIAADLAAAVGRLGLASLVVSGGSTPRPLFEELGRRSLPWDRVWVTLADERWVAVDDDASNEALVRRHLLTGEAAVARWVGLKTDAATPEEGRGETDRRLRGMPRPFDVVVLGMGGDGHTASLFPGAPELAAGLTYGYRRLCLAVRPPGALHPRISLTLRTLLDSWRVVLHLTGEDKLDVYRRALADGSVEEMPVRGVLRTTLPVRVELYWAP
ncbi:MAG: 6-phosphogluconolactonase [Thermoanaerobaculia bacterium]